MRIVLIFGVLLTVAACAHKERPPAPLEPHPAGKVSEEALPPPSSLTPPPVANAGTDAPCEPKSETC